MSSNLNESMLSIALMTQMIRILSESSYPLQVLFQDQSRAFQAGLSQPGSTQPEALCVDRHHCRVHVHLNDTDQISEAQWCSSGFYAFLGSILILDIYIL